MKPPDPPEREERSTRAGIALVRRGGTYLVRQRPLETVYAGYWEFPGGKCEPGESPAQATVRECLEETGLSIQIGPLRHATKYRYPHGLVELFFYDCSTHDPMAQPAAGSGFVWVTAHTLASLRFPEANETVIADLGRPAAEL